MPAPDPALPPAPPPVQGLRGWAPGLGLTVLLLGLAALAIPRAVQAGDAGEFATVMLRGGVPHPSGYPWMRALGLVTRGLAALGVPPAAAAAWPCAAAGVAAWILLWPVLARWAGRGPATLAVAVLATASPVLIHVNDSEVWGPHLLAAAALVRIAARPGVRPWALGLAFGLAISHHLSAALLLPVVVGAAWPRPLTARRLLRVAAEGVGAGVVGLLPYLSLALGDGGPWRWGDTRSLEGLGHHVLRGDYGVFQLSLHQEDPAVWSQWARALDSVGSAVGGGLPGGPVAGAAVLLLVAGLAAARRPASLSPARWWGLWGAIVTTTLAFPAAHNIDPQSPFGAWILERFDLLTCLVWATPLALAAARLWALARRRLTRGVLVLGAVVLPLTQIAHSLDRGLPSQDDGVERYARDLLRTPAPGRLAIVIGTDDHRLFPVLYAQHVLDEGRDTLYIDASLLSQPWYREHLRARWPALPEIDKPVALIGHLWRDEGLRDTPIYLANIFSRPARTLPVVPQGVLWRVLPPHALEVDPSAVVADHLAALRRYGPPPLTRPKAAHPWTGDLQAAYNDGTRRLLAALHAEGREVEADAMLEALGPWRP